jgi:hypothetical protein
MGMHEVGMYKNPQEELTFMANYENHPVHGVLSDMAALVESKANDYADDENVYSNFEGSARLTGRTVDEVFHVILGIKMERLRQLMTGKVPNHESIEDTLMDAANYFALWLGYRRQEEEKLYVAVSSSVGFPPAREVFGIQLDKIDGAV